MIESYSKIVLGTVQFGLNYGINNSSGKPSQEETFLILDTAYKNGIIYIDTADAYGNAIELIGEYHRTRNYRFSVYGKFKSVRENEIETIVKNSLEKLHIDSYTVYSYHSYNEFVEKPYLLDELCRLKNAGLIKKIGISLYSNDEFNKVIDNDIIDVIQIPYNIFDNRNAKGNLINRANKKSKEVHVRSVFLQGLFFMDGNALPTRLSPLKPYLDQLKEYSLRESTPIQEIALNYALFDDSISKVLIGVDNIEQLQQNLESVRFNKKASDFVNEHIKIENTELLNPVNWI
jgi:aryl-alcohol dehydrogenase-like predicted oxidoreductase